MHIIVTAMLMDRPCHSNICCSSWYHYCFQWLLNMNRLFCVFVTLDMILKSIGQIIRSSRGEKNTLFKVWHCWFYWIMGFIGLWALGL